MSWCKIGDEIVDAPKTLMVWAQDPAAFALDTRATLYAAKHLTDGFIPSAVLDVWFPNQTDGTSARLVKILVDVGRWIPEDGGFRIHDFLDSNRSREDVEAEREKRRKSGKSGGRKSGVQRRKVRDAIQQSLDEAGS